MTINGGRPPVVAAACRLCQKPVTPGEDITRRPCCLGILRFLHLIHTNVVVGYLLFFLVVL
jgi:hypothetical protein